MLDEWEGLMGKMWRRVQVANSGLKEVLAVVVETQRGIECAMEVLDGKQSCNPVHLAVKKVWRGP